MRRAGVVLALLGSTVVVAACASTGHTWQDEFTARLEGAGAAIEETLGQVGATKTEEFRSYADLGRELEHEAELLEGLEPPRGCAEVQVKGLDHVKSAGLSASEVHPPDYPDRLLKADRVSLETELQVMARVEQEAEACA